MTDLLQSINSIYPVSQELQEHLFNNLTPVTIKKGAICSNREEYVQTFTLLKKG